MPDPEALTARADQLLVAHDGRQWGVTPGEEVTFGRADDCTVALDPDDLAISRLAGRLHADGGVWWVLNTSGSRALGLVDEFGLRSVLPPGHRRAVEGPTRVIVDGVSRAYELALVPPAPTDRSAEAQEAAAAGQATVMGEQVVVNDADRAALIALFAGYLEQGARYDPNPKSYAAAAARLGWPRTTLVKRVEYLRSRLSAAGVPNLSGPFALNNLAEYALTTGLITRSDLEQLRR